MSVAAETPSVRNSTGEFVVIRTGGSGGLALVRTRRRDALLARLWHRSLDRQLAAGAAPECSRLLAARAGQLVGRPVRRRLARRWEALVPRTGQPQPASGRAVLAHTQAELADELARLAGALRADRPAAARGVALAGMLLPVAASGVRRLALGGEDVVAAAARTARAALGGDP